jgi:hypothetical protein
MRSQASCSPPCWQAPGTGAPAGSHIVDWRASIGGPGRNQDVRLNTGPAVVGRLRRVTIEDCRSDRAGPRDTQPHAADMTPFGTVSSQIFARLYTLPVSSIPRPRHPTRAAP